MKELYIPKKTVATLQHQFEFPLFDLTDSNADMLKYVLSHDDGTSAHGEYLQPHQTYIHLIADYALKLCNVKTRYSEDELAAFSQGFASFEAINIMVHPPRIYNITTAQKKVRRLLMAPNIDPFELEAAELLGTADTYLPEETVFIPEVELAERQGEWQQKLPNTFDVIVNLGERRHETMEQIHARTAGAHIAYQLATEELDAA